MGSYIYGYSLKQIIHNLSIIDYVESSHQTYHAKGY